MKKLVLLSILLLSSSIFSMEEKKGFGISINTGNPLLNLMTSAQFDIDEDALMFPVAPSVYYIYKINRWNIEPAIAIASIPAFIVLFLIGFLVAGILGVGAVSLFK